MHRLKSPKSSKLLIALTLVTSMVLVPLSFSIANVTPAAAATCTSVDQDTGVNPSAINSYYAAANITTNSITLCGQSFSDSSVWAMLANSSEILPSGFGYAQSGYIKKNSMSSKLMFAEYLENADSSPVIVYGAAPPSGAPRYDESYDFNAGVIDMNVDNDAYQLLTTDFDPAVEWTSPWIPEWEGEVHGSLDDIPGTASAPTYFSNVSIKTCRSCSITTPTGLSLFSQNATRFGYAWVTPDSEFDIWTK
jgi:hypothetical protein